LTNAGVHHVLVRVRGTEPAEAVLALLDAATGAVSAFAAGGDARGDEWRDARGDEWGDAGGDEWRLEAYSQSPVLTPELSARLALAAAASGGEVVELREEKLRDRDWLAENQLAFPPLRIGRFFVYGSHYRGEVPDRGEIPAGAVGILLDAATAFGTGEHPSTRGCLMALEGLARRHIIRRPLDIGTGTGILAIAAAKLLHRAVSASDIDPGSVMVARHNASRNRVAGLVRVGHAAGYRGVAPRRSRYDLILANILARPLAEMAADLAGHLAPGGHAVLSGLLRGQEPIVLAPHRSLGLALEQRIVIDGWSTLVLRAGVLRAGVLRAGAFGTRPLA
jgi:ribosomal protein L11 methyltransferase